MRDGGVGERGSRHVVLYPSQSITNGTERFSKSRHLEELHKHQSVDKKAKYADFHSKEFWLRFHETRQKAKEEVVATGIALSDDLQLMATISGRLEGGWLYGAGSEVADLKAESCRAATRLPPCYLEVKQSIMRRVVNATISGVCTTFDEYMKQFAE
ncbi:hypothetical protein M9H77_16849 [Catharanthus roseus]|uniref:Uncharacterized protein n=1 Tax=Catharanthus roseus TaxID=4058 RepID=A0ACC0B2Z3_CATRO|nr:hypothetical protein M9H77_16849 [Catharanthus roseus]